MLKNLRLTEDEAEGIRLISLKLNGKRLKQQKSMLMDSKIAHDLISKALAMAEVTEGGEIVLVEK